MIVMFIIGLVTGMGIILVPSAAMSIYVYRNPQSMVKYMWNRTSKAAKN